MIAAVIVNAHLGKGASPVEPVDFFPHLPSRRQRTMTVEEQVAAIMRWHASTTGEVVPHEPGSEQSPC